MCSETSTIAKPETFEFNVLILGWMAKVYAETSRTAPQRMWGSEMTPKQIVWNDSSYVVTRSRLGGVYGLVLTVNHDHFGKGGRRESFWFPPEAFDSVSCQLPCVRL